MQNLVILGATGSIGDQTLDIISRYPDEFKIVGMSARQNAEKLIERCDEFDCDAFFLADHTTDDQRQVASLDELMRGPSAEVGTENMEVGTENMEVGTEKVVAGTENDVLDHLIVADHGLGSYEAVLKALTMRKRVSIANKELLIAHGSDIMYLAREQQAEVIPLDSEHNAIYQCLQGEDIKNIRRVIITASGGPFRQRNWKDLSDVTPEQVLKHPNWSMGAKTTVDSATLVNKAFEIIETHILFDIPYDKIEVRLHPESIVHAIVEFTDGSAKMLSYQPDMRFAIGYALFFPDRAPESLIGEQKLIDYDQDLHFERIQQGRFPCFDLVLETARQKPHSLHRIVENDIRAVDHFLSGEISFHSIIDELEL